MKRVFLSLFAMWCVLCGMSERDLVKTDAFRSARYEVSKVARQYNKHLEGLDRCAENGKYADQFTIDRRCYVTDEQKKKFPYNTVVSLQVWSGIYGIYSFCTGVITKNPYDSELYIYTAGHCVKDNRTKVFAMTQDEQLFPITNIVKENTFYVVQDYAAYSIPQEYQNVLPYTTTATSIDTNVDTLGYGVLEILSDNAIRQAKQKWKKILSSASGKEKDILKQISSYTQLFPTNSALKASFNCNPYRIVGANVCQGYKGDSGGPIFNKDGKVAAVQSWGIMDNYTDNNYIRTNVVGTQNVATIDRVIKEQTDTASAKIIDFLSHNAENKHENESTRTDIRFTNATK